LKIFDFFQFWSCRIINSNSFGIIPFIDQNLNSSFEKLIKINRRTLNFWGNETINWRLLIVLLDSFNRFTVSLFSLNCEDNPADKWEIRFILSDNSTIF
jgi:hypothetical protein